MLLNMTAVSEYKIARFVVSHFYILLYQKLNKTERECLFL